MAAVNTMAPLLQGLIWTITALSLLFLGTRLYIKWNYRGQLWYDDYALVVSMVSDDSSVDCWYAGMLISNFSTQVFLLVNASLIQRIVVLGYGRHIAEIIAEVPDHIRSIVIYLQIISGVVRLSTNIARVSFAITLLRLSTKWEKVLVWFSITTLLAVTTPAIILPFVSCRPYAKIFDPSIPGTCIDESVSVGYFIFEGGL